MSWHSNFVKLSPKMLLPPFIFLLFFITYGECLFPIQFRQVAKNSTETTWVRSFGWWKSEQSWANKKTWRFHHKSFWWSRVNRWTYTFKGTWLCFNWWRCDILVHQTVSFIRFLHAILSQMKKKKKYVYKLLHLIESQRKELKKTLHNDPDINSKIDFSKKVNFVIHGWLGGLHDGNMHSPRTDRSNQGLYGHKIMHFWKMNNYFWFGIEKVGCSHWLWIGHFTRIVMCVRSTGADWPTSHIRKLLWTTPKSYRRRLCVS